MLAWVKGKLTAEQTWSLPLPQHLSGLDRFLIPKQHLSGLDRLSRSPLRLIEIMLEVDLNSFGGGLRSGLELEAG